MCAAIIGVLLCSFAHYFLKRLCLVPLEYSVWQVKKCVLVIFLLHHDTPALDHSLLSFIHSFIYGPTCQPLSWLYLITYSITHMQIPGSLRQEVLQLQLSAKVSLKGNSSDLWPLPHSPVLLQAYPQALDLYYSACCRNLSDSSVHHSWLSPLQ